MLCVWTLHYQQVLLECFDGSEVTSREGNELVVQKENCVVEEMLYRRKIVLWRK